ncbi:MAG: hypothetical protein HOM68_02375 [Gemmatimonadetes bacterium]|jgi:hypothetical protein|nr:hypothetical protein [Gemmatimonadota bacterium]MBT4612463.1 hypothetical protein [Gemmatimonadota bacterium]MBT5055362.1 hypothetical protein [Gemmatimonadota bacterium]MBT5144993.1 hypothetical protein [Gemmatimonadota bacterium]MBT5590299.1 hypothetical protein [Gemmatimonadota bacterium]
MFEHIPSETAEHLHTQVQQFRDRPHPSSPPDDVNALLAIFPRVNTRKNYILDYMVETSTDGVELPIRPFARPADDDSWLPFYEGVVPDRDELVEQLYKYLVYENTPAGAFEYAYFIIEMWSLRVSRYAAEWLESIPIFTENAFDAELAKGRKVNDLRRPEEYAPTARTDEDGSGRVRFLVYTPMGWERIYYLESRITADGYVDQQAGEIVADMGTGLIF